LSHLSRLAPVVDPRVGPGLSVVAPAHRSGYNLSVPARQPPESEKTFSAPPPHEGGASRHPYLLVLTGPQFGEVFDLAPGEELLIGRSPDAQIRIQDEGVSRRHATIVAGTGAGDARLADAGSANGTWVNGGRVHEAVLQDGTRFQVGAHTTLKFVFSDDVEAEYQRRLAHGALHEPLTGLYNRRHFMDRLSAELAASQRHGRPLSLLLVDVDHFKRVNDAHGHLAGDEVLKSIAQILQGVVRKEDVVARFGGEEFVVLARETALTGARALGERIRRAVERSRVEWDGREIAATVSVGVTVGTGLAQFEAGRTAQQLLDAADRALYRAKQGGRNGVVATPALGE
jgi:diguanylate cyclase (GGDEF)-like protein